MGREHSGKEPNSDSSRLVEDSIERTCEYVKKIRRRTTSYPVLYTSR